MVVSNSSAQFYLDGSTDSSAATGTHTFYIGKGYGENEWDGIIDEVRIQVIRKQCQFYIAT